MSVPTVATAAQVEALAAFMQRHPKITFLTGAGMSTHSGIPDYRSPGRPKYNPIQHSEFVKHESFRKRYWARSGAGFDGIFNAQPNDAHRSLAALERKTIQSKSTPFKPLSHAAVLPSHQYLLPHHRPLSFTSHVPHSPVPNYDVFYNAENRVFVNPPAPPTPQLSGVNQPSTEVSTGRVHGIITQNVDSLHLKAGSSPHLMIELHGALRGVRCLSCHHALPRAEFQQQLMQHNAGFYAAAPDQVKPTDRPDGDVELSKFTDEFVVPSCPHCNGVIKPNVVFFGGAVPAPVVEAAKDRVLSSDALIVLGSTLTVFSSYRFVLAAAAESIPIAIVNYGATRGDAQATLKLEAPLPDILHRAVELL
jgi:NAD-dependent SIR2 family protein deacetylase